MNLVTPFHPFPCRTLHPECPEEVLVRHSYAWLGRRRSKGAKRRVHHGWLSQTGARKQKNKKWRRHRTGTGRCWWHRVVAWSARGELGVVGPWVGCMHRFASARRITSLPAGEKFGYLVVRPSVSKARSDGATDATEPSYASGCSSSASSASAAARHPVPLRVEGPASRLAQCTQSSPPTRRERMTVRKLQAPAARRVVPLADPLVPPRHSTPRPNLRAGGSDECHLYYTIPPIHEATQYGKV